MDIKKECLDIISDIEATAHNLALDIEVARYIGLEELDYTEFDLRFLKDDYRKFNHIIENMPHFKFVAEDNLPLYCCLDYNPKHLCNRCSKNTGSSCAILDHIKKLEKALKSNDLEALKDVLS